MTVACVFHPRSGRAHCQHFVPRHKEHPEVIAIVGVVNVIGWRNYQPKLLEKESRYLVSRIKIDVSQRCFLFESTGDDHYSLTIRIGVDYWVITVKQRPVGQIDPKTPLCTKMAIGLGARAKFKG